MLVLGRWLHQERSAIIEVRCEERERGGGDTRPSGCQKIQVDIEYFTFQVSEPLDFDCFICDTIAKTSN
jgi:hypothetical protein